MVLQLGEKVKRIRTKEVLYVVAKSGTTVWLSKHRGGSASTWAFSKNLKRVGKK